MKSLTSPCLNCTLNIHDLLGYEASQFLASLGFPATEHLVNDWRVFPYQLVSGQSGVQDF